MVALWDDRVVQMEPNTGLRIDEKLQKRIATLEDLYGTALLRLQELGEKEVSLTPLATRVAERDVAVERLMAQEREAREQVALLVAAMERMRREAPQ